MATYIYETIPQTAEQKPRRFEVQQSMKDSPLTFDPETGLAVRRVISGGYGVITGARGYRGAIAPLPGHQGGCCGTC